MKRAGDGLEWDQARFFLALSRCRTLSAAAARLGVNQTTVARRIQALERALATPLFRRAAGIHSLTDVGRRLVTYAEQVEASFQSAERDILGEGTQVSGSVRIGSTEGFGSKVLMPLLGRLISQHPNLHVDLLAVSRLVNLSRREADIVITLDRPARGPYWMTKLTDYALGLYGSPSYLERHAPVRTKADLEGQVFISYIDDLLFSKELQYLSDLCEPSQIVLRSTSLLAQHHAVRAGIGLSILPKFLVQGDSGLVPVLPEQVKLKRTFWMLMPLDIKEISRMQVTWNFLREAISHMQSELL